MIRSIEMWRKGYVLKEGKGNQKRRKKEQKNLITQADVQKYDNGQNSIYARHIFEVLEKHNIKHYGLCLHSGQSNNIM